MLSLHNTHHGPGVERSISESADHTGVGGLGIWADLGRWYKLWTFQVKFSAACNVTPVTSFDSCFERCSAENNGGKDSYLQFCTYTLNLFLTGIFRCFLFLCARWQKPAVLLATCSAERGLEVIFQIYFYQNGSWMIFNVVIRFWSEWNWCSATCLNTIRIWKHTAHPDPYHFFPQTESLNFDGFSFFQFSLNSKFVTCGTASRLAVWIKIALVFPETFFFSAKAGKLNWELLGCNSD